MHCTWRGTNVAMINYHDNIYGILKKDSNTLFKWLSLEIMQAGLSWQTVINKELEFDIYYQNFDLSKVSNYNYDICVESLLESNIIRNKLKLKSIINNATIITDIEKEICFFDYLTSLIDIEQTLADNINEVVKVLKKRGFKFIGYEIIKSFYESVGIINNHDNLCVNYIKPYYSLL
jgi:DNA-3-methyladenine glycosylase I